MSVNDSDLLAFPTIGGWWLVTFSCGHVKAWNSYDYCTHPEDYLATITSVTAMEGDHVRQR